MILSKGVFFAKDINTIYHSLTGEIFDVRPTLMKALQERNFVQLTEADKLTLSKHFIIFDNYFEEKLFFSHKLNSFKFSPTLNLTIYPTYQCNFSCPYCYQFHSDLHMGRNQYDILLRFIRKQIPQITRIHLTWFGGEPLLEFDSIIPFMNKLKAMARETCRPLLSTMITNGSLLTPESCKMLIQSGITSFMITLDGPKRTHDKQRPFTITEKSSFDTIIENLRLIRDTISSSVLRITIRINISPSLGGELIDFLSFLENEFDQDDRFDFSLFPVGDWGGNSILSNQELILHNYIEVLNHLINSDIDLNFYSMYKAMISSICETTATNSFIISPELKIIPCNLLLNQHTSYGYIQDNGSISINETDKIKWIYSNDIHECEGCHMLGACLNSSCPAQNLGYLEKKCGFHRFATEDLLQLFLKTKTKERIKIIQI